MFCKGITKKGKNCGKKVKDNNEYCHYHLSTKNISPISINNDELMSDNSLSLEQEILLLRYGNNPFAEVDSNHRQIINNVKFINKYEIDEYKIKNIKTNFFKMELKISSCYHDGYCSDNDGTIYQKNMIKYKYFYIPDSLKPNIEKFIKYSKLIYCVETSSLFSPFDYVNCYCGCCKINYEVVNIEIM